MNRLLKILDQSAAVRTKQSALSSLTLMQSANAHLSLLKYIYPAGHRFDHAGQQLVVKCGAALVFIDHKPSSNWGHPCTYRFHYPATGEHLYSEDALFPPTFGGGEPLERFHAPVAGSTEAYDACVQALIVVLAARCVINILATGYVARLRLSSELREFGRVCPKGVGFETLLTHILRFHPLWGFDSPQLKLKNARCPEQGHCLES